LSQYEHPLIATGVDQGSVLDRAVKGISVRALAESTKRRGGVSRCDSGDTAGRQPAADLDQGPMLLRAAGSDRNFTRGAKKAGFISSRLCDSYTMQDALSCFSTGDWWTADYVAPPNSEFPFAEVMARHKRALDAEWLSQSQKSLLGLHRLRTKVSKFQRSWGADEVTMDEDLTWADGPWKTYGRLMTATPRRPATQDPQHEAPSTQPEAVPNVTKRVLLRSSPPARSPPSQPRSLSPPFDYSRPTQQDRRAPPSSPSLGASGQPARTRNLSESPPRVHESQRNIYPTGGSGNVGAGHKRTVGQRGSVDESGETSKRSRRDGETSAGQ
jgi:hypothetical protein